MPKRLEEYLRTALASIGDAVISTDAEGRVLFVNKVGLSLLRAAEADIKGKHVDEIFNIQNEFTRRKTEALVFGHTEAKIRYEDYQINLGQGAASSVK